MSHKSLETAVEFDMVDTYETTRYRYQYIQREVEKLVFGGRVYRPVRKGTGNFASVENDCFNS